MEPYVENLVVDSAGFIKYAKLENIGKAMYTIAEVIEEIKDKTTRDRLKVLPYELNFRNPSIDSLKFVTEFSKKTGDYASLSAVDLKIIALTYELEKFSNGTDHLKTAPNSQNSGQRIDQEKSENSLPPGFYVPTKHNTKENIETDHDTSSSSKFDTDQQLSNQIAELSMENNHVNQNSGEEGSSEEEDYDDNDESWITPENLASLNKNAQNREPVAVGCITGDFAVQNVLMHIGLHVISVEGMMIKRLNTYILRCFACFKTTSVMTKKFCPECGNSTLKKVAITVNDDGTKNIHISKRKTINTKGFNKPIPLFRGGKHANDPILSADQPTPQNRLSNKALQKLNVMDTDYVARDSPFLDKDVYSRNSIDDDASAEEKDAWRKHGVVKTRGYTKYEEGGPFYFLVAT